MEITVLKDNNEPKNVDLLHQAIKGARRCIEEPFVRLSVKIPRHIITIDEKYLRHCLELIYITSASNSPSYSWEPCSSKMPVFSAMNWNPLPISLTKRPGGEWIIGSITRSKSMLNILKSPLLHHKDKARPITLGSTNLIDSINSRVSDSNTCSKPLDMEMLHLTWKPGSPRCVFSIDGRKEAYMAKMTEDCIYVFHQENESEIVGRMRVSTSVTLDQSESEIKQTEFVLFGVDHNDNPTNETVKRTPARVLKKNYDKLPMKVTRVFKKSRFLQVESTNGDSCAWPRQLDDHFLPNSELVAIVLKERVHTRQREEEETRGWGLKFLKKMKKNKDDNVECSTSIDIVVPAGIHGGPRKREGGPSGLLQRWRSAGQCDCGGWDMGCSFKVLQTRACESKPDSQYRPSFELFTEGSSVPRMKMVNVNENLYIVHFESGISALQTFATAVAIIHCRSSSHQLKQVGDQKSVSQGVIISKMPYK